MAKRLGAMARQSHYLVVSTVEGIEPRDNECFGMGEPYELLLNEPRNRFLDKRREEHLGTEGIEKLGFGAAYA